MTRERTYNSAYAAGLPISKMIYPDQLINRLKYYIFKIYNPMHPFWRDLLLMLGLIRHTVDRQDYLLGTLREDRKVEDLLAYLVQKGFGNHFIAWVDEGEISSLRLLENFEYQYHIRIFKDGQIRGHYEYTPECHPIHHLKEKDMRDGRELFSQILKGWIN